MLFVQISNHISRMGFKIADRFDGLAKFHAKVPFKI